MSEGQIDLFWGFVKGLKPADLDQIKEALRQSQESARQAAENAAREKEKNDRLKSISEQIGADPK